MGKERCLKGRLKENKKVVNKINVILNLFQDLIRLSKRNKVGMLKSILQTPYTNLTGRGQAVEAAVQHDVFFYNNAFTLIELLVVVLIVGILAAVALPQYQNVVWKSRGTQLYVAVQALHAGQKAYYLANGTWATTFDELSIEIPFKSTCGSGDAGGYTNNTATDCRRNTYGFVMIQANGASHAMFRSDSPKYRWSGFIIPESETNSRQDELICTDIGGGKKSFCALMGYNTRISCNNNGVCSYNK